MPIKLEGYKVVRSNRYGGKRTVPKYRRTIGESGFTLIEVMIAILILAVGMLAMAMLQVTAIRGGSFSDEVTQASIFGQNKIEELRNTNYASINNGKDSVNSSTGITFTRTWTVKETPPPGTTGVPLSEMKSIVLKVSWLGPHGQKHQVQFATIVYPEKM